MADVFVSHATADHAVAMSICRGLEAAGTTCWLAPRDVSAGGDYAEEIVRAISATPVFLLLVSRASERSPHVRREIEQAAEEAKPIVPVRLSEQPPAGWMRYFLSGVQFIEAWSGQPVDRVPEIDQAVRDRLGEPTRGAADPAGGRRRRPGWSRGTLAGVLVGLLAMAVLLAVVVRPWSSTGADVPGAAGPGPTSTSGAPRSDAVVVRPRGDQFAMAVGGDWRVQTAPEDVFGAAVGDFDAYGGDADANRVTTASLNVGVRIGRTGDDPSLAGTERAVQLLARTAWPSNCTYQQPRATTLGGADGAVRVGTCEHAGDELAVLEGFVVPSSGDPVYFFGSHGERQSKAIVLNALASLCVEAGCDGSGIDTEVRPCDVDEPTVCTTDIGVLLGAETELPEPTVGVRGDRATP